uniref:Transmembrane protein 80 n=1 Tax=Lepeophtheirus salmonis TaxID=72036 RepID=C1BS37_LEPSM|nr:Transmembrane protein 80 [Lepeophtheirus salmonis]
MDSGITFSILLYFNIFYFGLYAVVEFSLFLFKYTLVPSYTFSLLIYEVFLFASTVLIECIRLLLGQKHNDSLRHAPFNQRLRSIFQILVLTVPSMYAILYFTAWQTVVTRLDAILGVLMILLQTAQFVSAFIHILL